MSLNLLDFHDHLETFWDEILDRESMNIVDTRWAFQYHGTNKDGEEVLGYFPQICRVCEGKGLKYEQCVKCDEHYRKLSNDHLLDHFAGKAFKTGKYLRGALGISICYGQGKDKFTKLLVIDFDSEEAVRALKEKIVPVLKKDSVPYAVEHGPGKLASSKCHLWMKCEKIEFTKGFLFLCALLQKCGIDEAERKRLKLELYPKKRSYIRLFGGIHLRRNCVYPVFHQGKSYTDPLDMIKVFCGMSRIPLKYMEDMVKVSAPLKKKTDRVYRDRTPKGFRYVNKSLKIPDLAKEGITKEMQIIADSCQAVAGVLNDTYYEGVLGTEGEHEPGLFLGGACVALDAKLNTDANVKWFEGMLDQTRLGGAESAESNRWTDPERPYFVKCSSWKDLGKCGGCTFRNHEFFENPSQLLYGKRINKTKIRDINPISAEEGRIKIIHKAKERIKYCIDEMIPLDIVLAGFPGMGKSFETDRLAVDLAREGRTILLAVPNAELAIQHARRIESWEEKPFIVLSHENLFKKNKDGTGRIRGIDFECPEFAEIKRLNTLGVGSKIIKKRFCKKCPFADDCPYPGQYSKASDPKHRIVIIQHAHFNCRETLFTLLSDKSFDCLIVDEEFISNTYVELKPQVEELERFKQIKDNYPWLATIYDWLTEGGIPGEGLKVSEEDLESVKEFMDGVSLPWNVPTYLMYYAAGHLYDKRRGLFVFYPVPDIPVRVFTDATPPIEMLKIVLDNKKVEVYGKQEVLDYRILNSKTKIRQVLDSKTTKRELAADDYALYYEWLEFIGDEIREKHKGKKVLITTYQNEKESAKVKHNFLQRAEEWLQRNYPDIFVESEIVISWMALGTNEFADCHVQYQLAGLHLNTKQMYEIAYQIKCIENWWNRIKGRPLVDNMYPWHVTESSGYDKQYIPLQRIEFDPSSGAGVYQYDFDPVKPWTGLYDSVPTNSYLRMAWDLSLAKRQQAMRIIRNTDNLEREVTIFDKSERGTQAVTESFLTDEKLAYIRTSAQEDADSSSQT